MDLVGRELGGDDERITVITLGDAAPPSRNFTPSANNLAVFFSLDAARAAGLVLPAG